MADVPAGFAETRQTLPAIVRSMASAPTVPFARWSLVAVFALLASALLVTASTTYFGVRNASATLLRGQAETLQRTLRIQLAQLDEAPTSEDLELILREEAPSGLRYLAALGPGGTIQTSAGTPTRNWAAPRFGGRPSETLEQDGSRVRTLFRIGQRRGFRGSFRGPPVVMAVEFEPVEANALRATAGRTFAVGAVSATVLLVVAATLVRRVVRRETLERQLEQSRRLASLGEMSAVLAHEIRNPLASLKGNAQLLAMALASDEKHGPKAKRVVDEALRLESLTQDLLEYVRTGELTRAEISPAQVLRTAVSNVKSEAIELDEGRAPARWSLDGDRVQQVLINLLENAVQAGAPVRVTVYEKGDTLWFDIQDSGPGVPAEDRERIFEPFFTRKTKGTGLGLALVKRVVTQHGGSVTVESAAGGGALFRVALPRG